MSSLMPLMLTISMSTLSRIRSERPTSRTSCLAVLPPENTWTNQVDSMVRAPAVRRLASQQDSKIRLEIFAGFVHTCGNFGQVSRIRGGHQARSCVHQRTAMLGDTEGGLYLRETAFIDLPLSLTHAVEGKPADEARAHRKHHSSPNPDVELGRYAETALE